MAEILIKDAMMTEVASQAYIDIEITLTWTDRRLLGSNDLPQKLWTPYLTLKNTAGANFVIKTISISKEYGVSPTIRQIISF